MLLSGHKQESKRLVTDEDSLLCHHPGVCSTAPSGLLPEAKRDALPAIPQYHCVQHRGHALSAISCPHKQQCFTGSFCFSLQGSSKTPKLPCLRQQPTPEQHKPTRNLSSSAHFRSLMPHLRCSWLNWAWLCCAYLFSSPAFTCSADISSALPVGSAFTSSRYSFPPPSSLISPHDTCLSSPACPGISSSPYLKKKSLLPDL